MTIKLPSECSFHPKFITDPGSLFWPVLHEIMSSKFDDMTRPGVVSRISGRPLTRTQRASLLERSINGRSLNGQTKFDEMTPTIAMIAGLVWMKTGKIPDLCMPMIYRDGNDFASWHTDYEAILGPAVGDAWVGIVSLGAERTLDFSRLPREPGDEDPDPVYSVGLTSGSLLWMRGKTQRDFLHRIQEDPDLAAPRISLTFLWDDAGDRSDAPYQLMGKGSKRSDMVLPKPLFVGSPEDATRYWEHLAANDKLGGHDLVIVGPDGDSIWSLTEATLRYPDPSKSREAKLHKIYLGEDEINWYWSVDVYGGDPIESRAFINRDNCAMDAENHGYTVVDPSPENPLHKFSEELANRVIGDVTEF